MLPHPSKVKHQANEYKTKELTDKLPNKQVNKHKNKEENKNTSERKKERKTCGDLFSVHLLTS